MNELALKVAVPVVLVALATLAGRRWGDLATGLVGGLPIVAGPILFFYAREQGPAFASEAAELTLFGILSLCAFLLTFGWRAWAGGSALSCLALGWAAFAAVTLLMDRVAAVHSAGLVKALVYALAALYLGRRSLPPAAAGLGSPRAPDPWDLSLRMAAAAVLVLTLTGLAQRLGPRLGGLLTAFPVASSVLSVFALRRGGREALQAVLKGLLLSLNAYAFFCAALALALPAWGLGFGFLVAVAVAVLAQSLVLAFSLRRAVL